MNHLKKLAALVVVVVAGMWAYYANVSSGKPTMDMNMRIASGNIPFPVTLASVGRGSITGTVTYTGSVAPFNEEDIYPRVTGRIVEMRVYPGNRVEKGEVVARLDDVELSSRVREAEAVVAAAQANRVQTEADVAATVQGVVQMEKELAAAEAEAGYQQAVAARDEQLFSRGALSQQEAENSRAMATAARDDRSLPAFTGHELHLHILPRQETAPVVLHHCLDDGGARALIHKGKYRSHAGFERRKAASRGGHHHG